MGATIFDARVALVGPILRVFQVLHNGVQNRPSWTSEPKRCAHEQGISCRWTPARPTRWRPSHLPSGQANYQSQLQIVNTRPSPVSTSRFQIRDRDSVRVVQRWVRDTYVATCRRDYSLATLE